MAHRFVLITDSTVDENAGYYAENDIPYAPLSLTVDGRTLEEDCGQTLSFHDFYDLLRQGKQASTAQAKMDCFLRLFEQALAAGQDVLYVGFSSGLSGTYQAGCMAAAELAPRYPDRKILLVDSLSISMPEAMVVRVAAEKRLAGASIEEAAAAAEAVAKRSTALFMVDDLEYLKRGGRVSATAAFFGGMLDIKPVLYISPSGKLEPLLKIKGNKKAMRTMAELCAKCAADPQESHMVICQADCEEQAEVFEGMIREKVAPKSLHTQAVGPVIGSHCGPGTLAICFFANCDDLADMD